MYRLLRYGALSLLACSLASAQQGWVGHILITNVAPTGPCGGISELAINQMTGSVYICPISGQWPIVPNITGGNSAAVPSGLVTFVMSGTCPVGFTEVSALNGKMLKGTVTANGNVGTSGGADTITPTGTVSPITSVVNHTHSVSVTDPGHNHTQNAHTHTLQMQGGTTAATTGTHVMNSTATGGSSRAATTPDTANSTTATNNSATTGISASTANPVGGVASITPTFTGNAVDPSPSFLRVIFCSAN